MAPLPATQLIGCIGTHGCSDKQGCVGESVAKFSFLVISLFCLGRLCARGRPLSYGGGGSDDAWSCVVVELFGRAFSFCIGLCACLPRCGDFLYVLRLVSPAQCRTGL